MTNEEYLKKIREHGAELRADPVRLKEFMRKVMGPPHKTLEGKEKEQTILLLQMIEPFKETNNQQSWTDYYMIGETEYQVTYFPGADEPIIDKILPEDEE
jgi:hypothetical protein